MTIVGIWLSTGARLNAVFMLFGVPRKVGGGGG